MSDRPEMHKWLAGHVVKSMETGKPLVAPTVDVDRELGAVAREACACPWCSHDILRKPSRCRFAVILSALQTVREEAYKRGVRVGAAAKTVVDED